MIFITEIETPLGKVVAGSNEGGICLLEFADRNNKVPEADIVVAENVHLKKLRKELDEYFKGKRKDFTVPLTPAGTSFRKEVWLTLGKIPFGSTISYSDVAMRLGNPLSVRAVANANSKNPVAIIIPCHRVIGENGNLTGYAGGLWRKKWLIEHENKFSGKPVDLKLF